MTRPSLVPLRPTLEPIACSTCMAQPDWLMAMECPLVSDGTVCWLCEGTGEIHVCAQCFYTGPPADSLVQKPPRVEVPS